MDKCVFLDRDGVINRDMGTYTYELEKFEVIAGVPEAIDRLKEAGYKVIVITNQAGIAKGMYTAKEVYACHRALQELCKHTIDDLFYSPYHHTITASLSRKPDSLMFEKAIAKHGVDVSVSWMVGDAERDLIAAQKAGVPNRILVDNPPAEDSVYTHHAPNLVEAVEYILGPSGH